MNVTMEISPKRIADLMITAIECNDMTRSWCAGVYLKRARTDLEKPWYATPALYANSFVLEVVEIVDESTHELKKHRITMADFKGGLKLMADKYPRHFGDILAENEDAVTADIFLQLVTLKEVTYG